MLDLTAGRLVKWGVCLAVISAVLIDAPTVQAQRRRSRTEPTAPAGPQVYKSRNFHVMTDLSREDSGELLQRLETMLRLVSAYFGRRNPRPIEMYVIDDFENWPAEQLAKMSPEGVATVRAGGGLTITQVISSTVSRDFESKAVVYAGADHGTPQHEAVHAYCGHAFGETGPVWYSEGMAEVGQYWRQNDDSVNAGEFISSTCNRRNPSR